MQDAYQREVDLGRCGAVTLHLSKEGKRLLLEFATELDGLDKSGLNSFIDALKKVRDRMDRWCASGPAGLPNEGPTL